MNINDNVWVRLTKPAIAAYVEYYSAGGRQDGDAYVERYVLGTRTKGGWTREQLWVLMAVLGPHTRNGGPQLIEGNEILFTDPAA